MRHIEEQKGQREGEDHAGGAVVVSNCSPSFSNLGQKKKEEGKGVKPTYYKKEKEDGEDKAAEKKEAC
jgi:formylmethanofuran dehydrogenase subunit C